MLTKFYPLEKGTHIQRIRLNGHKKYIYVYPKKLQIGFVDPDHTYYWENAILYQNRSEIYLESKFTICRIRCEE